MSQTFIYKIFGKSIRNFVVRVSRISTDSYLKRTEIKKNRGRQQNKYPNDYFVKDWKRRATLLWPRKTQTTNEIFLMSLNAIEKQHERGVSVPFHLRTVLENVNLSCFFTKQKKKEEIIRFRWGCSIVCQSNEWPSGVTGLSYNAYLYVWLKVKSIWFL